MPVRPPLSNRLATAAVWPAGIALTSWRYTLAHDPDIREETAGSAAGDRPPPFPADLARNGLQLSEDGVGPLFHRRYVARIREAQLTAEQLVERIGADPNCVSPTVCALPQGGRKAKAFCAPVTSSSSACRRPWDGPVRVAEVTSTRFRLVTLPATSKRVRLSSRRDAKTITSASGSSPGHAAVLQPVLERPVPAPRMAKEVQLHMWSSFLEQIAELAGGRLTGGIEIVMRRLECPNAAY